MNQSGNKKLSQKDFVLLSAPLMAAYRAIENQRNDRLFYAPFAAKLVTPEAEAIALKDPEEDGRAYLAVRTRFFDDFLLSFAHVAPQVVSLGAGMDTRAFRLNWTEGTKYYEIDYPEVLNYKDSILKDTPTTCHRYSIAIDLTDYCWVQQLLQQGYDKSIPSVWLLEGLLYYLSDSEVHALLNTIMDLTTTGSWIGLDLLNQLCKESTYDEFYHGNFHSGFDNPEELLATYGWKAEVLQPGEEGANFNRYIHPFPPRNHENVERVFLIKAKKIT
ncbi:SAM-dependent methyltransferase [Nostoc flagelliforme FACHB-838]|uniref:S-adenosyl-L-methionine-dependent methyltransferase n=1 Tax=Nostoc flagelliforme FACHB-838 TaxID=2692904 RepID=A0ABR8E4D9_9NOSO|nr:SAM-dependent methyltransferase [Nostoc flagelliforme]MBD2536268.1 SAM-dependent methyltransferase [Nostoc flagelliforme FACHB-838]